MPLCDTHGQTEGLQLIVLVLRGLLWASPFIESEVVMSVVVCFLRGSTAKNCCDVDNGDPLSDHLEVVLGPLLLLFLSCLLL